MSALTHLMGIATDMQRTARTPSFVVAPDVWDRLLAEVGEMVRGVMPGDDFEAFTVCAPGGEVTVRKGRSVPAGCVETWEQRSTTRVP